MSERPALEELYAATKGEFWRRKWNWCSDESYSKWEGIRVDRGGHVIELSLQNNYLQGSLKNLQFVTRLINLEALLLTGNNIGGRIPPNIGTLVTLHTLDLSWNLLKGSIPVQLFELTLLRVLRLDNNQLSGEIPQALGKLVNLHHLNLSRNLISGVVPDVGYRLVHLKLLDLSENRFDGYVPATAKEYLEMHARFLS